MDFPSRHDAFVTRALRHLADDLGFHPVAIARPELAPFAAIAPHAVIRTHPDDFDQLIAIVPAENPADFARLAAQAERFAEDNAALLKDKKLRIFFIGIGLGSLSRAERGRVLAESRLLNDQIVIRRFFLSLDRRRLFAKSSPWGFAPGFEINPCDPDENVFVELVRKDRYLKEPGSELSDEDHRVAVTRDRMFLMGLSGRRVLVRTLVAVNVAVFAVLALTGGSNSVAQLLRAGAKSNGLIEAGQYWRFVTPIFLHLGILHLLLNSLGLWFFGELIERVYGTAQFALVYFLAGIRAGTS